MQALTLQQTVVEAAPLELVRGGAASDSVRALAARLQIPSGTEDITSVFEGILNTLLTNSLSTWIVDWVDQVCGDAAASSDNPTEAHLLSGDAITAWAARAAAALRSRLAALLADGSGGSGGELARVGAEAEALLQIVKALRRAGGGGTRCAMWLRMHCESTTFSALRLQFI
jgi:hypothetical protein